MVQSYILFNHDNYCVVKEQEQDILVLSVDSSALISCTFDYVWPVCPMLSTNQMSLSEVGAGGSSSSSNFVWKYCRMCALEVKQGVYIFGEEGRRLQLPEKIRKTVAILVLKEDSLPKKICTSCCNSLEAYTQFKDSVVDAQDKLSHIAKSIEKSQEQNFLHLRNKQAASARSPKRQKLFHSTTPTHSASHMMFPTPSIISHAEPDLAEPSIECDEPPSSVASASSEEDENSAPNSPPKSIPANEIRSMNDEVVQVSSLSHSPPFATNKLDVRDSKPAPQPTSHELTYDDTPRSKPMSSSKSPIRNTDSGISESGPSEADIVCGYCAYHSNDKDALLSHNSMSHTTSNSQRDPLFRCSLCPRISYNYDAIRHHVQKHKVAEVFKCPDCDKGFSMKEHLNVHISSKHNPTAAVGSSKSFATLVPHPRRAQPGCSSSSTTLLSTRGENESDNENAASNSYHAAVPTSSTVIRTDNTSCTTEKSTMHCENNEISTIQTVATASASPLKTPEKNKTLNMVTVVNTDHHSPDLRKSLPGASQDDVGRNAAENTAEEQEGFWKCDYCDKILRSKNGYDVHLATHKGRRFTCEHCGVPYTQKSSLAHHIKVHHTNIDKEFECPDPECKKKFKTLRQFSWHKKTHEKPLTDVRCPQREKTFKNMISLKTHMKLHRGSKKFPCAECPKAFYTKAKLQEHMNSHSGKRPFGCPVVNCTKVFSCFSNYSKHFKKNHHSLIGPKGNMIPQPKMVESNNNELPPAKQNEITNSPKKSEQPYTSGSKTVSLPEKESVIANVSRSDKSQEMSHQTTEPQSNEPNATVVHAPSYHSQSSDNASSQTHTLTVLRPLPTIINTPSVNNMSSQTPVTSSPAFNSQTPCSSIQLLPNNSSSSLHSQGGTITLHASSNNSGNENLSVAHAQSQPVHSSTLQPHSHNLHHNPNVHHPVNVHAHNNAHLAHNNHNPISGTLPHHVNQFQSQNHIQTVWQPVVLPNSKSYHSISTSTNLSNMNGLELLDCAGSVGPSESLPTNANNHSHSQLQQSNVNGMPTSIAAAHHATSHSSVVHAHQGISVLTSTSGNVSNPHPGSIHHHHGPPSGPVPHSSGNSSSHHGHGISVSSSSTSSIVPSTYGQPAQQNEPMELIYKDSNNFQDMPMELTKVFQRDPLELCVRQDFGHTQSLMDLSSRVVNVSVGGNSSMNVSTISIHPNGNNSNTTSSSASQNHYNSISSGTSGSILSVPYHKTVELVERELSLNDFTGAFRQPIDLIARSDEQSHELCSEGNLVDLSLRSSFGQDQSASSFLRELIDLSSRPDSYHGEINLTNKQPTSSSHSQMHHSHSSNHHPIPKLATSNGNPIHSHHHNSHHSHHHHHHIQSHQPISSTGGPPLQTVLYTDASSIFNMQN